LALLHDGYDFIGKRRQRLRSDVFETRLLLQPTLCLTGADAARLFYDEERFQRAKGAPGRMQRTLTGTHGVQSLDGGPHRHRKAMFVALLAPERMQGLVERARDELRAGIERRRGCDLVLFDLAAEALCRAVCAWSGVPLQEPEVAPRTTDFVSMIEAGGRVGVAHWRGRLARRRAEGWAGDLVKWVRDGRLAASAESVLGAIAWHEDGEGQRLDEHAAAVELLNVLRPTVAVAYYLTFTALALQSHVEARRALLDGTCEPLWFVQEVRRCYPFFPFVAARTREEFEWREYRFPAGTRTLLDLYGTNHDARTWPEPERFLPERFRDWQGDPFALIPQGAGDTASGHRCPGEAVTIELMRMALEMLTSELRYDVPPQDLRLDRSRIPTLPNSGFVMSGVRSA
jgi:fatty-acid peroxygenase